MGVIFIGGIYGVGKSTLCGIISKKLEIPFFNSSDLISGKINENYGANKYVSNLKNNQVVLLNEVAELLKQHSRFILAGHFCILKENGYDVIDYEDISKLQIERIIVFVREPKYISETLKKRDAKEYDDDMICSFQKKEIEISSQYAKKMNVEFDIVKINFDDNDITTILNLFD